MIIDYNKLDRQFAVYMHSAVESNDKKHPIFIGVSRYADIIKSNAARRNPDWKNIAFRYKIELSILHVCFSETEAIEFADTMISVICPKINVNSKMSNVKIAPMVVRCLNDMEEYASFRECAAYYSIAISSLSHHLRGDYGYRSIKGLTFQKISQ